MLKLNHGKPEGDTGLRIEEINDPDGVMMSSLLDVWESSVRATHLFLSDEEIKNYAKEPSDDSLVLTCYKFLRFFNLF